jgi:hypothetical protein
MAVAANCAWVEPLVRESQEDIEDNRGDGEGDGGGEGGRESYSSGLYPFLGGLDDWVYRQSMAEPHCVLHSKYILCLSQNLSSQQ